MALLIGLVVATFAGAGLAVFWSCYRRTRARAAGLSAFALGLAVVAVFVLIHATVGPAHPAVLVAVFVIHVAMSLAELLLLGAVMGLRDPPGAAYRKAEGAVGPAQAALAVLLYGGVAWWIPQHQDEVPRLMFFAVPLLIGVAVVARFGLGRDGLVGGGVFLVLVVSNLLYVITSPYGQGAVILVAAAAALHFAAYFR